MPGSGHGLPVSYVKSASRRWSRPMPASPIARVPLLASRRVAVGPPSPEPTAHCRTARVSFEPGTLQLSKLSDELGGLNRPGAHAPKTVIAQLHRLDRGP